MSPELARRSRVAPPAVPRIVWEDEHLLVVDKPAGLVVHPGAGHASGTLVDALAGKVAGGDPERPGVVHRLDRDTSGLIVVARSGGGARGAHELVRERAFERTYLALVRGRPRSRTGRIEAPIGRDRGDPTRISLDTDSPREAATHFEVEELCPEHALLRVRLETGRMHQIRVHLAAVDLPVVGDPVYGVREPPLERQFLHATALAFPHPFTGERIETVSELPPDLAGVPRQACRNLVEPRTAATMRCPRSLRTGGKPRGGRWSAARAGFHRGPAGVTAPKPRKGLRCPSSP